LISKIPTKEGSIDFVRREGLMDQEDNQAITILIAEDGSEHSQAAKKLVYELPLAQSSSITIATVVASEKDSEFHLLFLWFG
jgi:hypothetical protein